MDQFNQWFRQLTRPWVMILIVILVTSSILYGDRPLAVYLHGLDIKLNFPFIYWLSHLGDAFVAMLILPFIALVYRYLIHDKAMEIRIWFLWLCVLVPSLITGILKTMIGRARPGLWVEQHIYGVFGWHIDASFQSFPSGHTTAVTGLMIGLVILVPRYKYLWLLLAVCLIATRVLLVKHFLSDVIMSAYFVWIELWLLFELMKYSKSKAFAWQDLNRLCMIVS